MRFRPSLMMLTGLAAGLSAVSTTYSAAAAPEPATPQTRLGASIQQDLTARDRAAAQRKRQLDLREQAARAAEQRLKAAAGSGAAPQRAAPDAAAPLPSPAAAAAEERYAELARIYQAMKPKAAAAVFEQLAMDVQVEVANRMRERSTALIMGSMTPKGAAALTMAMARRKPAWTPVAGAP